MLLWTWALGQMSTVDVVVRKSSLFFLPHRAACGVSVSRLEIEPVPPAMEAH